MNNPLLQKASIVLSPTAYGTSTLNSIKPVKSLGLELVTNGTFDTDSNWTKGTGWTISGGLASCDGTQSSTSTFQTTTGISGITNKKVKLSFNIKNYQAGSLTVTLEGTGGNEFTGLNSNGVYEIEVTSTDSLPKFKFNANLNFIGSIDNASIKLVTDADFDFTRSTTATRVNESGLIETIATNTPRINFTSGVGSILLEPEMTNHYLKSEAFDNFQGTINLNNATSPTGVTNAAKLTKTSASDQFLNLSWSGTTISTSTAYTMSLFVKHNGDDIDVRYEYNNSSDWGVTWTALFLVRASGTTASTVSNCTSKVDDFGNGWYRISCTFTTASSVTATSPANLVRIIGGDTETILVFGAQMEKYAAPTSYIPTSGSAVTRSADAANNAGNSDLINSTEGVLYAEIKALADDSSNRRISLTKDINNKVNLVLSSTSNTLQSIVISGGVVQFNQSYAVSNTTEFNKIAIKYKVNDFAFWINGIEVATDTSGNTFSSGVLTTLTFDNATGTNLYFGNCKMVAVFKEALTDAELTTLTS